MEIDPRLTLLVDRIHRGGLSSMPRPGDPTHRALDLRDEPPFDPDWVRANDEIRARLRTRGVPATAADSLDTVAEAAFLACAGNTELAPYVSDDLRLIAEALLAGGESPWITALLATYARGELPGGSVTPTERSLQAIVAALAA